MLLPESDRKNAAAESNAEIHSETYQRPQIVDLGSVEELTHGSREQTSDEPNSGYQGG